MKLSLMVLVGFVLCATGCIPAVVHSPRVDPGFSLGASAGLGWGSTRDELGGTPPYDVGPFGIDFAYGWQGEGWRPPIRLGAEVNLLLPRLDPDLFVQVPTRALPGWMSAGAGFAGTMITTNAQVAYGQLGVFRHDGLAVYTTQGFLWQPAQHGFAIPVLNDNGWMSMVAVQRTTGPVSGRIFVMNVNGRQMAPNCFQTSPSTTECQARGRPWFLLFGYSVEHRMP